MLPLLSAALLLGWESLAFSLLLQTHQFLFHIVNSLKCAGLFISIAAFFSVAVLEASLFGVLLVSAIFLTLAGLCALVASPALLPLNLAAILITKAA